MKLDGRNQNHGLIKKILKKANDITTVKSQQQNQSTSQFLSGKVSKRTKHRMSNLTFEIYTTCSSSDDNAQRHSSCFEGETLLPFFTISTEDVRLPILQPHEDLRCKNVHFRVSCTGNAQGHSPRHTTLNVNPFRPCPA